MDTTSMIDFSQLGVVGASIITVLGGVIVFLYRELKAEQRRNGSIQESRLVDARETRDKLAEPMEKLARQQESTNDLLTKLLNKGQ